MNLYRLNLLLHLLGMAGLTAGLAVEWFLFRYAISARNEIRQWIRATRILMPIVVGSSLIVLGTGIYLATIMQAWPQGWVRASMAGLMVMAFLGILAGARTRHLRRVERSGEHARLRALILHPALQTPVRVRIALFVAVLMLMVVRGEFGQSLAMVGAAVLLGLLWSAPTWRLNRSQIQVQ